MDNLTPEQREEFIRLIASEGPKLRQTTSKPWKTLLPLMNMKFPRALLTPRHLAQAYHQLKKVCIVRKALKDIMLNF